MSCSTTNIVCADANSNFTEEASIRLVGGSNSLEGRVEISIQGHWGTVCGNLWDLADATVVCRELGYPTALQAHNRATFGPGSGFIWLDRVTCTGFEPNLFQCRSRGLGVQYCSHPQDAGVTCSSESERCATLYIYYKHSTMLGHNQFTHRGPNNLFVYTYINCSSCLIVAFLVCHKCRPKCHPF